MTLGEWLSVAAVIAFLLWLALIFPKVVREKVTLLLSPQRRRRWVVVDDTGVTRYESRADGSERRAVQDARGPYQPVWPGWPKIRQ